MSFLKKIANKNTNVQLDQNKIKANLFIVLY